MKYDPEKHHRRSIRLKGYDYSQPGAYFITICTHQRQCLFGEIIDGEMSLNEYGVIVRSHWLRLPQYYSNLKLDEFVVMPNHLHGILILSNASIEASSSAVSPNKLLIHPPEFVTKPAPKPGVSEIVRGFKTFSSRRINQKRKAPNTPVWQRTYYDRIIHNSIAFQATQNYIQTNPHRWNKDQLHRNTP